MILSNIDMATILIVLVLGHLLTGVFIVAYTWKQNRSKSVNIFLISKLLQLTAWIMIGLRGVIPNMVLVAAGNSVLFTGTAMELTALMILKNFYTEKVKRYYNFMFVFFIIIFVFVTAYGFPENIRIAVSSLISGILMVFPVYKLFADDKASGLQKVISVFYSLIMIFSLFRVIAALTTELDMNLASKNIYNTWLFLIIYIVMLTGSTGFILLDKEKQDVELLKAASLDGLTNILNRKTFILRSKEVISLCVRKQENISFLLIDIDDFKKVNDEYGHFIGDVVLQNFANIIKKQLRDYDLFGRYGGEEFAILLPGTDGKNAEEVAERLRSTIENSHVYTDIKIKYTISIGFLSILPDEGTDIDMLYKLCDKALYLAKSQGKNCSRRAEIPSFREDNTEELK
ncbi:GGDEF domain-containing protein [Sedimentibacter hydroxybenzoicus DSM 7310]|uniref:GGDEF domain-containing protein n=1 Tax=Sedimentibacter hydroxybenzoicus DSM 7310 TaxID=1123245 RepID=A0A974BMU5_SEDHY|nr:GGDEF domain-containing protein [Sedimentibacter hydroxybenzoicus]NYB75617.1 GGDEF domain-containing protein [Sedimentibacter hydroxybenzoicus DSM 7310]